MDDEILVYTIIVTYNGRKWIKKCFESLIESNIKTHILVIDNLSTDGTPDFIGHNFPDIELIEMSTNLGFGNANNIGIKEAVNNNADYIFLLNQDAWVEKDTLQKLIEASSKHPNYGIISPIHLSNETVRRIDDLFLKYILRSNYLSIIENALIGDWKDIYPVNFINAAAWLIPQATIRKVGYFDSLFFMYGEDDNYINRVKYHNLKVGIVPQANIIHDRVNNENKNVEIKKYINRKKSALLNIVLNPNKKFQLVLIMSIFYITKITSINLIKFRILRFYESLKLYKYLGIKLKQIKESRNNY